VAALHPDDTPSDLHQPTSARTGGLNAKLRLSAEGARFDLETLARALGHLLGVSHVAIERIGTRRGEKMHETLLSREEMVNARDEAEYYPRPPGRPVAAVRALPRRG